MSLLSKHSFQRFVSGLVTGVVVSTAGAQELEIAVSPSPVGSGARAAGMADAFVAIADDATAASWNPAGLIQLERPEISFVGSFNSIREDFHSDFVGFDSTHSDENFDINYFSGVWPLPWLIAGRNVTVALSYQRKYDFTRSFDATWARGRVNTRGTAMNQHNQFKFDQEGGLSTITPAIAVEITPTLSLGVAFNLWRSTFIDDNGWSQDTRSTVLASSGSALRTSTRIVHEEYEDFQGENLSIGALWFANEKLSLGARYDTAFTGEVDYESTVWAVNTSPGFSFSPVSRRQEDRKVRFPASLALGVAYRFSDKFWMSLDVTRTDWDDFWVKDAAGVRRSLVDASNLDKYFDRSDFGTTTTVRLGAEYLFLPEEPEETLDRLWTLRGGVFYDQEPANGSPDDFYGGAFGIGVLLNERINLDFAYQLRYGNGVNSDFFRGISGFEEDVVQHRVLLSTVIYF